MTVPHQAQGYTGSTSNVSPWARWCLGLAVATLLLSFTALVRAVSLDVFHEMALFREALHLGRLPRDDVFAYTDTVSPTVHHEWGVGAVLYLTTVATGLGGAGLVLLRLALLGVIVACSTAVARLRGAGPAELIVLAPLAGILFWPGLAPVRAHLFTFAFLALLLLFLELDRRGDRRWLLFWPVMVVLWVNLHGGWVVGAGVVGLAATERFFRSWRNEGGRRALGGTWHLFAAASATAPLALLNPWGVEYFPYLWNALLLDRPRIMEWGPLWSERFRGAPLILFLASVAIAAYTAFRGDGWKRAPGVLILVVTAVLTLRSIRIMPIYTVVWLSYVSAALARTPASGILDRFWIRHHKPVAIAAIVISALGFLRIGPQDVFSVVVPTEPGSHQQVYPAGAVAYLAQSGFRGNLMTPFGVGAYVSWHLHPDVRVGMDSRYEVAYRPEFVEEAFRAYGGEEGWEAFLERFPTHAVLVGTEAPLYERLQRSSAGGGGASWILVYTDDAYSVFAGPAWAERLSRIDLRGATPGGRFP